MKTPDVSKPVRRKPRRKVPPDVLHTPDGPFEARVRPLDTHRVTPEAYAVIVSYVLAGCSDEQISRLLRERGFIREGELDLSYSTFRRIRQNDDCRMSAELLTLEARQVGHNILSQLILDWAVVGRQSLQRLAERDYEKVALSEDLRAAQAATQFLTDIFSDGLPSRLRQELEADLGDAPPQGVASLTADQIAEYCEAVMSATYARAVKIVEQRRAKEGVGQEGPGGKTELRLPAYEPEARRANEG